jgi:hypothetical protein
MATKKANISGTHDFHYLKNLLGQEYNLIEEAVDEINSSAVWETESIVFALIMCPHNMLYIQKLLPWHRCANRVLLPAIQGLSKKYPNLGRENKVLYLVGTIPNPLQSRPLVTPHT